MSSCFTRIVFFWEEFANANNKDNMNRAPSFICLALLPAPNGSYYLKNLYRKGRIPCLRLHKYNCTVRSFEDGTDGFCSEPVCFCGQTRRSTISEKSVSLLVQSQNSLIRIDQEIKKLL